MNIKELSLDLSVLYRLNQKYYDKALLKYSLGYTQMVFILLVYENEGSGFNDLASIGCFDKGTVTKSVAKLAESGYLLVETSKDDKRNKHIYTTDKAKDIVYDLYKIRNDRFSFISADLSEEEVGLLKKGIFSLISAARVTESEERSFNSIKFYRLDKVSFSDFKNHASLVLYTGGCRYRCRTCDKKDLVFLNESAKEIKYEDIFEYLETRKNLIDSVVIKGTDPLEKEELSEFAQELKSMNLEIKIETNGFNYEKIIELIEDNLIDAIAVKIHSSKKNYPGFMGLNEIDLTGLEKTVKYLINSEFDYEFLINVSNLMTEDEINEIGKWLLGAEKVVLRNFEAGSNSIDETVEGVSLKVMDNYQKILSTYVKEVKVI